MKLQKSFPKEHIIRNVLPTQEAYQNPKIQEFAKGYSRGKLITKEKQTQGLSTLEKIDSERVKIFHEFGQGINELLEAHSQKKAISVSEMRNLSEKIADLPYILTPLIGLTEQYANHPGKSMLHKHGRKAAKAMAKNLNKFRRKFTVFEKALLSGSSTDKEFFFTVYVFPLEVSLEELRFSTASLIAFLQRIITDKSLS